MARFGSLQLAALAGMLAAAAQAQPPDLTGIWTTPRGAGGRGSVWPQDAPYTAEARSKIDAYQALVAPQGLIPGEFCVGRGMPASALQSGGYPMEIIQRPEQVTIIYELYTEVRRVYTDGSSVDPRDLFATRNGHSVGRWEGDTLVVTTTHLKEGIDQASAHSDAATIVERYRLGADANGEQVLRLELTLTDPKFYERPVTVEKTWMPLAEGGRMLLYECTEPAWEEHLEKLRAAAAGGAAE